jgi:hypothetical protein
MFSPVSYMYGSFPKCNIGRSFSTVTATWMDSNHRPSHGRTFPLGSLYFGMSRLAVTMPVISDKFDDPKQLFNMHGLNAIDAYRHTLHRRTTYMHSSSGRQAWVDNRVTRTLCALPCLQVCCSDCHIWQTWGSWCKLTVFHWPSNYLRSRTN